MRVPLCALREQLPRGLLWKGLRLWVKVIVCSQLPLLSGRGLMGHAACSHTEGWTANATSSLPAMGKEEYTFVLQVPP